MEKLLLDDSIILGALSVIGCLLFGLFIWIAKYIISHNDEEHKEIKEDVNEVKGDIKEIKEDVSYLKGSIDTKK